MKEGEGPQDRYSHEKTCSGCVHFQSIGQVFGRDFREDNTYCNHDQIVVEDGNDPLEQMFSLRYDSPGRMIEFHTRGHRNPVPQWCPYLKPKKLTLDERLEQLMRAAEIRLEFSIERLIKRFNEDQRNKEFFRLHGETGVIIHQPKTVWPQPRA